MTSRDEELRRDQSAEHYLLGRSMVSRLQPTLSLAARVLGFPTVMVNILNRDTQHTITGLGLDDLLTTPREQAICDAVIRGGEPLVVPDATADPRFADFPSVRDGTLTTYVGVPLIGRESLPIGVLCVLDAKAREVDEDQVARLVEFGRVVEDQLDLLRRLEGQRRPGSLATGQLAAAISDGEIVAWYQPVVELATGRRVGFEALARWVHPSGFVDEPDSFVPLAGDSDLIIDLDLAVMRQAMEQLQRWQQADPDLRMSVNLSSRHFDQSGSIDTVVGVVKDAGVACSSVTLELTETERLSSGNADGAFVRELQQRGFRVLLDDFGTGWSSLQYLLRLPADGVKIDRVMSLALGSRTGDALTRAITALANDLGLTTVIEGIETEEQARLAQGMGYQFGQGYLWSRPLPGAQIDAGVTRLPVASSSLAHCVSTIVDGTGPERNGTFPTG